MWFQIIKNDLRKRKSTNLILLVFVMLCTLFLASSVHNIMMTVNGLNYFMEVSNASDFTLLVYGHDKEKVIEWLDSQNEVYEYSYEELCEISASDLSFADEKLLIFLNKQGGVHAKALDENGNELHLKHGEVAISKEVMKQHNLKEGETLEFIFEGETYSYTIVSCKDILYGNNNFSVSRLIFTEEDYNRMVVNSDNTREYAFYINSTDLKETANSLEQQNFTGLISAFEKAFIPYLYIYDMIVAGLFVVVSLCLIIISLLVLRFSIVFTLEENYQEIGIMKAIGMRDWTIQKIYLIKYISIVLAGAVIGIIGSIPVGKLMIDSMAQNIVSGDSSGGLWIHVVCGIVIVGFVVLMCFLFTAKMRRLSAVTAMRSGENGERYQKRRGLYLYRRKSMRTIPFLALNDVICNKKRYLTLLFSFVVSFILITIPVNTTTTMNSEEMTQKLCIDTSADIYIKSTMVGNRYESDLQAEMDKLKADLKQVGYTAEVSSIAYYYLRWEHNGDVVKWVTAHPVGAHSDYLTVEEGDVPKLANEVSFSKKVMEEYDLNIGDTVTTTISGEKEEFIISGSYTDYFQMGRGVRLSESADLSDEVMLYNWVIMVDMDENMEEEELKEILDEKLPQYSWMTSDEIVSDQVGSIKGTMEDMQLPMTILLCALIMLVCVFMTKLFIVREKSQIAMLKSIGFANTSIRLWIVLRMIWVVIASMIISIPISVISNQIILEPLFGIMGAEVQIQVDVLKSYFIYPFVLLFGIILATIWATGSVSKITTKDMINVE